MLQCSFGMAPSTLNVIVPLRPKCGNMLMANITDFVPCVPVIPAPWSPGGQVKVMNMPALINNAKCMCTWGGNISVTNPSGSMTTQGK